MTASPQDVQAKLDAAVAALEQTTVGYKNKNWKTPPTGSAWATGLADIAAARAEAGLLLAPPVPPPPSSNPSGIPIPAEAAGWTRILTEDFTTPVALGAWKSENWPNVPGVLQPAGPVSGGTPTMSAYPYPWKGTPTSGTYWPEKTLSIHDSVLDRYLAAGSPNLIAAVCPRIPFGQTRLRILHATMYPVLPGFHVSELLWPDDNTWPRDGEIDWPEGDLTAVGSTSGFMHNQGGTSGSDQVEYSPGYALCDGNYYHLYGMEWILGVSTRLWRDNDPGVTWTSRVDATAMHYVMQLGVSFAGPPAAGVAGHVLTDWLTVAK